VEFRWDWKQVLRNLQVKINGGRYRNFWLVSFNLFSEHILVKEASKYTFKY